MSKEQPAPTLLAGDTTLEKFLKAVDLVQYESRMRTELRLRNAGDLEFVDEKDLSSIGMSRPEQKRLRKEWLKMYPPSSVFGRLKKKVFGKGDDASVSSSSQPSSEGHVIAPERITLLKQLGCGEFGAVHQASWQQDGGEEMQVAVKCVSTERLVANPAAFLQEAAIMTRMRHEHVVRLYGVVLDTKQVMLVSELAACGSLLECLRQPALRDSLTVSMLCEHAQQMARGMAYLEAERLIHRDLAARNVLVFAANKVKISDFGLSRSLGVGEDYYRSEFTPTLKLPIAWCAPECINFLRFTSASDVWSYAVTLWEMFSYGEMPWSGMNGAQILDSIDRERRHLGRPEACPDDMFALMCECWQHDSHKRPTFAQLVLDLPDRLPQTVRALSDCRDQAADHLQYKRDELIVVLDRSPPAYPDGFYWLGSLVKGGRRGLFRPTETVAHLGADAPAGNGVADVIGGRGGGGKEKKKEKRSAREERECERERRKALISQPQGDVRHTCHVGIDGTAFGLLQLDKKDLTVSCGSPSSPAPPRSTTPSSVAGLSVHSVGGGGGRPSPAPSMASTVRLRDAALSPPLARAPSQPHPVSPPPPIIAPKPASLMSPHNARRTQSMANGVGGMGGLQPTAPPLTASAQSTLSRLSETSVFSAGERQRPVHAIYARGPIGGLAAGGGAGRGAEGAGQVSPSGLSTADTALIDEVTSLDRRLTDYGLSILGDEEMDRRPLIKREEEGEKDKEKRSVPMAAVRPMTDEESARFAAKSERESIRVTRELEDRRRKAEKSADDKWRIPDGPEASFTAHLEERLSSVVPSAEWSREAQAAYRLLVECGDRLASHSPEPPPADPKQNGQSPKGEDGDRDRQVISPPPAHTATLTRRGNEETVVREMEQEKEQEEGKTVVEVPVRRVTIQAPEKEQEQERKEEEQVEKEEGGGGGQERRIPIKILTKEEELRLKEEEAARERAEREEREARVRARCAAAATPLQAPPTGSPALPPKASQQAPPELPPKRDPRLNYDNLNGFGAGARLPPPVPPKPRVVLHRPIESPVPLESIKPRGSLFSHQEEEITKF